MSESGSTPESDCPTVKPLSQQCLHYIAMHLEEFPVSQLSLLPVKTREELLWRLPIADLCQLEDTEYVTGIQDMVAYWKKPNEEYVGIASEDKDIEHYVEEWDETEYARAILYGQVAAMVIGCEGDGFFFTLPNGDMQESDSIIEFLYAVRILDDEKCDLVFPPRYSHQRCNDDIIDAVVSCFKGELPQFLGSVTYYDEYAGSKEYARFLSHAIYIGIHGEPFHFFGLDFFKSVMEESSFGRLEVLILEGLACELDERVSLDEVCSFISSHSTFLSTFRILKILSYSDSDEAHGFTVSQWNFDKFITAYFSACSDHAQKVHLRDTKIRCNCGHHQPLTIDQRYLHFKVVELDNCKFITKAQATPKSISHWLGQDISVLENSEGSCTFRPKVKEKVSQVGKKRKFSEIVYN